MDLEKNTLYRQIIMEHYKNPQNALLVDNLKKYSIKNPVCGDSVTVQLDIKDGVILDMYQNSIGCSISTSSTSIFTQLLKGKTINEAKIIIDTYYKMIKGEPYDKSIDLGDASVYEGVSNYPARYKCATVALEGVLCAIKEYENNKK